MAIESKILVNMHRAIAEGNFAQAKRAIELHDDFIEARTQDFVDYPIDVPARLDYKAFQAQFDTSIFASGFGNMAVRVAHSRGLIGRLEDFSHLTDQAILRMPGIGVTTLKRIRSAYPFIPQA